MSPHGIWHAAVLPAVLGIGVLASPFAGAAERTILKVEETADSAAVREYWTHFDEAWNERDAVAFSRLFAEDVNFAFVDRGQVFEGREAVREHFEERFPEIAPGIRHQTHVDRVARLAPGLLGADGGVRILRGPDNGRAAAEVLRRFAIFAVMTEEDGRLEVRTLRIFEQPLEESRAGGVLELRSYNLKPGTVDTFEALFHAKASPLLQRWGIDVVAYGRSLHDENSWILLRAFGDLQQRARVEESFYGSDEWREGPRDAILDCIESYTTVVLPFDNETVERIRQGMRKD